MPTNLQGLSDPSLAFNPHGIADWTTQDPFINIMHSSREWFWNQPEDFPAENYLDENKWLTSIPDGMDFVETVWDWSNSAEHPGLAESRAGVYILEYEGEGTIDLGGVQVLTEEPGRITFELGAQGSIISLRIFETDPQNNGNNIRNISIVHEDNLELHEAGALFNPEWLDIVGDARQLRLMDWMDANGIPAGEWADRPKVDDSSWNINGAPVEVLVQLANQIGVDPWFTFPHLATDEYVREFTEYVRDNLDPNLVATFELSNEVWNFAFPQTHYFVQVAEAEWGLTMFGFPDHYSAHAKRATEAAVIVDEVFGSEADARAINTIGGFTGNPGVAERLITAQSWLESGDPDYIAPHSVFDNIALTTYFGVSIMSEESMRDALQAAIDDPAVDAQVWLRDLLLDPSLEDSVPGILATLEQIQQIVGNYDMGIHIYEGGQHVHHLFAIDPSALAFEDFLIDFVRSEYMAELYQDLWDGWRDLDAGPFMQFGDVGAPGRYGSFPLLSHLHDSNPRADLLFELNETTPAWWEDRGGEHFQHGIHYFGDDTDEIIDGTTQEDFLIGRGGNDTIYGFAGEDGLHGGAGDDILIGGDGNDIIVGGLGNDTLTGNAGFFSVLTLGINNFSQAQGWTSFDGFPRLLGDIDGDGSSDIVGFGGITTFTSLSNGDGTFAPVQSGIENFSNAQGWSSFDEFPRLLGDINGDGYDDVVGFGSATTYSALSNGDGTFAPVQLGINNFANAQGWSSYDDFPRLLGDIDGDGNADIVGFGANVTFTALSNGDGTFAPVQIGIRNFSQGQGWSSNDDFPRLMGDFDGDGNADIVGFGENSTFTALSNGDGTFAQTQPALDNFALAQGWDSFDSFPRVVGDIDGDGNDDLIGFGASTTYAALSNGDGTFAPVEAIVNDFSQGQGWVSFDGFPRFLDDVNGDGVDNLVGFGATATLVYQSLAVTDADEFVFLEDDFGQDRITDFDDGLDTLDLSHTSFQFSDLMITSINGGVDTLIDAPGANNDITILGVSSGQIDQTDFVF